MGQEHDAKVMDVDVALATIGPTLCSGATWAQSRDFPCFSHYSNVRSFSYYPTNHTLLVLIIPPENVIRTGALG